MKFSVVSIEPRDERNMVLVTLAFSQQRSSGVTDNGRVQVFIEASDSYPDMRTRGVKAAQSFASDFAATDVSEAAN